ncbi:hypothetical protein BC351_01005 [Paenibacillus ferrarius]|uniref:Uncharacterized protein n=1 Tax=Paenibacillus ferrarius TaxID=1469647 RepID=A0A1V4HSE1_9BACL|nr:hypothetical protein [Paenibacillus ferrarius]OPH61851.1 hypothetical protein BC351_01005 [Paenibacillus ferrarius]
MNKIIKFVNETDIPDMVKYITNGDKEVWKVINQIKEGSLEFMSKAQELVDELSKHLVEYKPKMIVEALEDCMNNFRKGQRLEITAVTNGGVVLEDLADIEEKWIRKYFKVVGMSECL